jgi:hypothetical protein
MLLEDYVKGMRKSKYMKDDLPIVYEIDFQGLPICIENPIGSIRKGISPEGRRWETKFLYPYGFIKNTESLADNDGIDVFIGPNLQSNKVFIIHQRIDDRYDEDKVMLGFDTEESARDAYLAHFDTQKMLGPITEMSIEEFKQFAAGEYNTKDAQKQQIEIQLIDPDNELYNFLKSLQKLANIGHSFNVIMDPERSEKDGGNQKFFFDGDGAFRIESILKRG